MNSSLYIGATGMKGLAEGMQVTTNNLANVSTIGFKQQQALFSEIFPQDQASNGEWWNNQTDSRVAVGQVGMGLQVEAIRTIFNQGGLESTNSVTDLAINGKGFFQVKNGNETFYTRAGDFVTDNQGYWKTPGGLSLMGYKLNSDGSRGDLQPVQVDRFSSMPPKATTSISLTSNFNLPDNAFSQDGKNPFFSMLEMCDAETGAMPKGSYGKDIQFVTYDAQGNAHNMTAYFDGVSADSQGRTVEFVIAGEKNTDSGTAEAGGGVLMSGVLQFDSSGNLINMAAFTPERAGSKDLSDWKPAEIKNGLPVLSLDGNSMTVDFGISSSGGWAKAPASAAAIGANASLLPSMSDAVLSSSPSSAYNTNAYIDAVRQDGYAEGLMSNYAVDKNGTIVAQYSNGQSAPLWQIPVCAFTSEYNLYREGGNLFSANAECGEMFMGEAGTENFGEIQSYNIEISNVDMAQEMVNMILTQRGFQSNSKVVTTADEMLRKAMELKR